MELFAKISLLQIELDLNIVLSVAGHAQGTRSTITYRDSYVNSATLVSIITNSHLKLTQAVLPY